jgi:hypothetical protein
MNKKEGKCSEKPEHILALPWFLKLYPWYLLAFVIVAVVIHATSGITTKNLGYNFETLVIFYSAVTIPAALYYVGAGIHPKDLKKSELKKLLGFVKNNKTGDHWAWVRSIFIITAIITPLLTIVIITPIFIFGFISNAWFAVIIINSYLPITSTNMFLIPYGIDKRSTTHSITWSTIVCVPIIVFLITIFGIYLG